MFLEPKKQKNTIARLQERIQAWKNHWDKIFKNIYADHRRMANGWLPDDIAQRLKGSDYYYNSKLVPRIVPDAIQYMKAISSNQLLSRDMTIDFVGLRDEDPQRALDANDLVEDEFKRTKFRTVAEQLMEDGFEVGICFQERRHWRDIRPVVKYKKNKQGKRELDRNNFQTIFEGPRAYRLRPEMVYLDPDIRDPALKPEYVKHMVKTIGEIRKEADGLYKDFADNIKKIKPGDYDPTVAYEYDQQDDHKTTNEDPKKKDEDFPVLYTECWFKLQNPKTKIPVITCIGIANYNIKPYMLRYDIDPMLTGETPLEIGRVYPRNDRMIGESVPEKIRSYLLAKFYARNSRIDIVNLARDVTGLLLMTGDLGDIDSLLTKRKRIIKVRSSLPGDIKDIKLDTSVIPHLMNEEGLIKADTDETLAIGRIALGQEPMRRETATAIHTVNENSQIMSNYPLGQIEDSIIKPAALGYLIHSQLLMPERFKVRVLGKYRSFSWRNMKRSDILGVFDVNCYGSSEILAKGVKASLMNRFVQTWSANPNVRADWQGICREDLKMLELPSGNRYVPDTSFDVAFAEREDGMLIQGIVVHAVEQDNHGVHITSHLKLKDVADEAVMRLKNLDDMTNQLQQAVTIQSNIDVHIKEHQKFQQIINGQLNIGEGSELPTNENEQTLLRDVNSDIQTGVNSD